jgi:xylitol oxidase
MIHETNWAGNYAYRAATIHRPDSIDDLRRIVAGAARLHALGTRHTFNDIADAPELVSLERLDPGIEIDREAMTVAVGAGVRYGILAEALEREGFALHNMGSLPHISVGGATATGTHGSGDRNGNLSSAVCAIELVTSDGEIVTVQRGVPDFEGMVVHLGALGVVTRLTLDIQPSYLACQEVLEGLAWEDLTGDFDAIFSSAYSVSIFTSYAESADVLWLKHRLEPGQEPRAINRWRATAATANRHPVASLPAGFCTPQMLEPGPWCFRIPHFRLDQPPASDGEEIQTEYMVDRNHAVAVIDALRELEPRLRESLMISEIRSISADDLWLSTACGRDTVAFHFSWYKDQDKVDALLPIVEERLAEFDARPHWGKAFAMGGDTLAARYPKFEDFRALRRRLDPRDAFLTPYLERCGLA